MMERKEYLASLPRKVVSAGALFFDKQDRILIVKPTYKELWEIPGGIVEQNESPREACLREVQEETGILVNDVTLACVDCKRTDELDSLQIVFFGGRLREEQIEKIHLGDGELQEYKFISESEVLKHHNQYLGPRILHSLEAIKNNTVIYLENGQKK